MTRALSSSTTTTPSKRWVEKITARVFCPEESDIGGNPVTIFAALPEGGSRNDDDDDDNDSPILPLSSKTQQTLAQTCQWESVMVSPQSSSNHNDNSDNVGLSFFMPTGQEVSFCAHAAMAGAIRVAQDLEQTTPLHCHMMQEENATMPTATIHEDDCVTLSIPRASFTKRPVEHTALLYRVLRSHCGLSASDVVVHVDEKPSFCHASVARPKTLVYVKDRSTLLETCRAPTDAAAFTRALKSLGGGTTGLYLYTVHDELDGTYVARQFPIASGYPEDAATGIAAAALVGALEKELPFIKVQQGQAMGQPSVLLVENFQVLKTASADELIAEAKAIHERVSNSVPQERKQEKTAKEEEGTDPNDRVKGFRNDITSRINDAIVSYQLLGKIEIDDREEMEIDHEE